MSKAFYHALNIRAVPITAKRKAVSSPRQLTGAPVFLTRSSTITRRTEEERKRRERRSQLAEDMGLAWDPELEPDFWGPLWEPVATNKNQPRNSGASATAEDASSTSEELSTVKEVNSTTWPSSRGASGLSGGWSGSGESIGSGGSSSISDGWGSLSGGGDGGASDCTLASVISQTDRTRKLAEIHHAILDLIIKTEAAKRKA